MITPLSNTTDTIDVEVVMGALKIVLVMIY